MENTAFLEGAIFEGSMKDGKPEGICRLSSRHYQHRASDHDQTSGEPRNETFFFENRMAENDIDDGGHLEQRKRISDDDAGKNNEGDKLHQRVEQN